MNEKGKNKREWVKTAAIIFLSVMLVLTFFSNTIMNYSLPEVATTYVQSGTITAKIRGTGVVESGDPYQIVAEESRKVLSVAVRTGDVVQRGDVLLYLEDSDSGELKMAKEALEAAKKELDRLQKDYDMALLNENITASDIEQAKNFSTEKYRKQITAAQEAQKEAQASVKQLEAEVAKLEVTISDYTTQIRYDTAQSENLAYTVENLNAAMKEKAAADQEKAAADQEKAAADQEKKAADQEKEAADQEKQEADKAWEEVNAKEESSEDEKQEAQDRVTAAQNRVTAAQNRVTAAQNKVTAAQNRVTEAQNRVNAAANSLKAAQDPYNEYMTYVQRIQNLTSTKNNLELQMYGLKKNLTAAEDLVEQKRQELVNITRTIDNVTGLQAKLSAISDARETVKECEAEVQKQEGKTKGATVNAEISGTVISVAVTAGQTFGYKDTLVTLQPEGQGSTMSFTVTNEQARRLSVGDRAELVNAWRYDDVVVTLASIKPDKTNPGQSKELTFNVTGNIVAGQTLNISVGQKSANYDLIVPNSAIREDSNGKFILIVESKSSPLGNRYIASRVDVEVIASDDTRSAVSGALYGYQYVITTSTKPVEAGKQVRLADN